MLKENLIKGRKCSICSHEKVKQMNSLINRGQLSFRAISRQFCGNDSMRDALRRHTENCLKLELGALIKDNRIEQAINIHQEFREQLQLAKDLRLIAKEYVEAHPKEFVGSMRVALDAIKTTDTVLDKFAKLGGLYQQDRQNEVDITHQTERVLKILSEGGEYARQYFLKMCESGDFTPEVRAEVEKRLGERTVSDAVN
ncbi:hypothetical protein BH10ACI1_BH10ACI1_10880 [soil metagenome]